MFNFLKRKVSIEPPTDKQLKYAKRLGIAVTSEMSKVEVSDAISAIELKRGQRQQLGESVPKGGRGVVAQERYWNRLADEVRYILAVYLYRKDVVVDVLQINEASITEKGMLRLGLSAPKLMKNKHIGEYLAWDTDFEIPLESILNYDKLNSDFHDCSVDDYKKLVSTKLKEVRKKHKRDSK